MTIILAPVSLQNSDAADQRLVSAFCARSLSQGIISNLREVRRLSREEIVSVDAALGLDSSSLYPKFPLNVRKSATLERIGSEMEHFSKNGEFFDPAQLCKDLKIDHLEAESTLRIIQLSSAQTLPPVTLPDNYLDSPEQVAENVYHGDQLAIAIVRSVATCPQEMVKIIEAAKTQEHVLRIVCAGYLDASIEDLSAASSVEGEDMSSIPRPVRHAILRQIVATVSDSSHPADPMVARSLAWKKVFDTIHISDYTLDPFQSYLVDAVLGKFDYAPGS